MPHRHYGKLNLIIRSLLFSTYSLISIFIHSSIVCLLWPFPLRYRHKVIRHYLKNCLHMLKIICHVDYRIEGKENIPKNRNGILFSKHQSTWETFFLPYAFHEPAIILKRELLWIPFFGWGLAAADPIAINRSDTKSAMRQVIEKGRKCLKSGRWILIFPEGSRMPAGVVGKYKVGGARLAAETGYPVLPIAHNAGRFWPKRKLIKTPGTITLVYGPLIETKDKSPEEILAQAKGWIETKMQEIDRF